MKRQLYPINKDEFEFDTSIINISEIAEDYVKQITTQIDNYVIENLPDEVLKKLKNKIDKEYKKRCNK